MNILDIHNLQTILGIPTNFFSNILGSIAHKKFDLQGQINIKYFSPQELKPFISAWSTVVRYLCIKENLAKAFDLDPNELIAVFYQ